MTLGAPEHSYVAMHLLLLKASVRPIIHLSPAGHPVPGYGVPMQRAVLSKRMSFREILALSTRRS